ncbi:PREDICTED: histone-lysine N-methyltransferase SUVR3-like isoform X2 [Tarenaya hassleriana]|uniref:histone-lysine N-methyltransferase SUVR3-like isoform X2 n=1 Tax=Tarenaya hassleriana TaxID=28532 RepID=UPI00053C1B10|nr:PREDICTED: histone-lysine N-methyltransferase SUVR3-like isoform X2 [Tarenaya hassleriana]
MQQQSPKKPRLDETQSITATTSAFLRYANLILPWLTAQELAAISLTCKTLSLISKSITLRRSIDAARSLENLPVPFRNAVDGHRYAYFVYSPRQVLASSSPAYPSPRQKWGAAPDAREWDGIGGNPVSRVGPNSGNGSQDLPDSVSVSSHGEVSDSGVMAESTSENGSRRSSDSAGGFGVNLVDESGERVGGCGCVTCDEGYCPCLALAGVEIAKECGSGCGCGSNCPNRVTQKGISVRLKIVRDEKKGELLTTEEARRRQKMYDELRSTGFSPALLVVREHLPSRQACLRVNIDATRIGNIARFVNHSCDGGNLSTVLVRTSGELLPRLCLFARRDIESEEELTFSYGEVRVRTDGMKCFCRSSSCLGTLPCEIT